MEKGLIRGVIFLLVVLALLLQGTGGILDIVSGGQSSGVFRITSQHAWNDGVFLLLIAILLAVVFLK